jgi:PST family polysaccharide transporter
MLLSNMGLGPAIIQKKDLTESDVNTIFSFTLYSGFILMLAFIGFSYPISLFYDNPVYRSLGLFLSISLFFGSLNMIPNALLLKEKKFVLIGIRTITVSLVSGIITIILALQGLRYYAIVLHSVISSVVIFIWNRASVKVRFTPRINWKSIKKIRSFSSYQFAFSFMHYFSRHLDNLLIGKYIGEVSLGYYEKSYRLMLYPVRNLTHVITPILHPVLSDFQSDKIRIFKRYMRVVKLLSLLGSFITPFCYFAASELVLIFFGSQWGNAVPSFRLLALSIWAQMISSSSGAIFQSLGLTNLMFFSGAINSVLNIIFIIWGLLLGEIESIALLVMISYNLQLIITFFVLMKFGFKRKNSDFFLQISKGLVIMILIFGLNFLLQAYYPRELPLAFIFKLGVSSVAFIVGIFVTKQQKYVMNLLKKRN